MSVTISKIFAVISLTASVWLFLFSFVQAARIEPDAVDVTLRSGERQTQEIKILNEEARSKTYEFSFLKVTFGPTADDLIFSPLEESYASRLFLSDTSLVVPAQGEAVVTVTIDPPTDIVSESFAFALIAQEQLAAGESSGISVQSGLATLFFVTAGEPSPAELKVVGFEPLVSSTATLPVRFAALLTNEGAGNIQPAGQVTIRNIFGHTAAVLPLTQVPRRLPAKTNRVFAVTWGQEPQVKGLAAELRSFHIGPYTATLEVLSADGQNVLTSQTRVVLFPWRTVALVGGIFAFISFFVWRRMRRTTR